jgi:MFS family permease
LVALFSAIAWFAGGMLLSIINVYIGLHAEGKKRGKSFSLTMSAIPLGSLLGGIIVGQLIAWKGYEFMFALMGILWTSHILVGAFALKEKQGAEKSLRKPCSTGFHLTGTQLLPASGTLTADSYRLQRQPAGYTAQDAHPRLLGTGRCKLSDCERIGHPSSGNADWDPIRSVGA